jgi:hypothetical protein
MDNIAAVARAPDTVEPATFNQVRSAARAGEWGEAVDNLIAGLAETRAAVTTAERGELRSLLAAMGLLTDLTDGLNVQG